MLNFNYDNVFEQIIKRVSSLSVKVIQTAELIIYSSFLIDIFLHSY